MKKKNCLKVETIIKKILIYLLLLHLTRFRNHSYLCNTASPAYKTIFMPKVHYGVCNKGIYLA